MTILKITTTNIGIIYFLNVTLFSVKKKMYIFHVSIDKDHFILNMKMHLV